MYTDIGAYDMLYSEYKGMCRKALSKRVNYLFIHKTKSKNDGKYRIFIESKNTYSERKCETEAL